jgi:pre-rRNA-processing protein TSR3
MAGIHFVDYHPERVVAAGRRVFLSPHGSLLGAADRGLPLFLIDCAWRRVDRLLATVEGELLARRLPPLATAYPRRSRIFDDPGEGLASVEALFAALAILDRPHPELLAGYRFAQRFLAANPMLGLDGAVGLSGP